MSTTGTTAPALYRTWRPQHFRDLAGQETVRTTLLGAVTSGRVGHAYLFTGPRGTGKTSTARILARAANCLAPQDGEPCDTCGPCHALLAGECLDLTEIDAASHTSVDSVRDLIATLPYRPTLLGRKVVIIDECFAYDTPITLADGSTKPIGWLVETGYRGAVLSYNEQQHSLEPKVIIGHRKMVPSHPMVRITVDHPHRILCTINHRLYTPDGMVPAGKITPGTHLIVHEPITQAQFAATWAMAWGDGNLSRTPSGNRARLGLRHGTRQRPYLDYKLSLLGDMVTSPPRYQEPGRTYSRLGTYGVSTTACPQLLTIYSALYGVGGRKHLSPLNLRHLSTLGLALWYLDNGSLGYGRSPRILKNGERSEYRQAHCQLHLQGFSLDEVMLLRDHLESTWDIAGRVCVTAKGPVLWFTKSGMERLHSLIAPYVPECMEHKLLPPWRGQFVTPVDQGDKGPQATLPVRSVVSIPSHEYVYNIEVADNHNYFAQNILVANCHGLSGPAFNALLKNLEEPPGHIVFILATTEAHKVPATVASRCQLLPFRLLEPATIITRLAQVAYGEGLECTPEALALLAAHATGSLRDALALLDQARTHASGPLDEEAVREALGLPPATLLSALADAIVQGDLGAALAQTAQATAAGADVRLLGRTLVGYFHGVLLASTGALQPPGALPAPPEVQAHARGLGPTGALRILSALQQDRPTRSWGDAAHLDTAVAQACLLATPAPLTASPNTLPAPSIVPEPPSMPAPSIVPEPPSMPEPERRPEAPPPMTASLRPIWDTVLANLAQEGHRSTAEYARHGQITQITAETVVVTFAQRFHRDQSSKSVHRDLLEGVLRRVVGRPVRLVCQVGLIEDAASAAQEAHRDALSADLRSAYQSARQGPTRETR